VKACLIALPATCPSLRMKSACMLAGIFLSLLLLAKPSAASSEPAYADVEQEIQRGELTAAQATLEQALAANDRDFRAHLLLGIVCQGEGRTEDALKHFTQAQILRPNDPAPHVNIGRVLAGQGKLESAAQQFSAAVRLDPGNATAHSNWGILLYQQQQWPEAIAHLRKAVALQPADGASLGFLFQAYLATGNFASARDVTAQIEHLSPPSSETFSTLGALQGKAGDYPDAVVNLQKALQMEPGSSEAAYNLSLALLREGKVDDARAQLERVRETKDTAEVEDLLGEVFEREERPLDAVRSLERAVALEPQNEDYNFGYLTELISHKSYDAAILVGNAAVRNIPGSVRLRLALVAALYGADKKQEAHNVLVGASQDFHDSSLPLYLRSLLAEGEQQADSGLAGEAERYVTSHPRDSLALLTVGREEDRQGDPKAAILALNQSLAVGKESPQTQLTLAKVYSELQDWHQVIAHSSRAVALQPDMREGWYRLARALDRVGRKSEGDAAMKHFITLKAEQTQSPVTTFVYTLR
jgi:tetratricopeptide (TPR) repeat protein